MTATVIADRRLHPLSIGLSYLKNLPSTLLGLPALVTWVSNAGMANFLFIAAGCAVLILWLNWIAWLRFRYGVGVHEIVIESGVLQRNRRSIPFERIQDVDIERGPLERLLGLAKVRIETGGAGRDEGMLDSLSVAEADRLRAALRAGKARDAGVSGEVGEIEPAEAGELIFAMSLPRVLLSGLFNFSMLYLAGLFAALQTLEDYLPFDLYDWGRWVGFAEKGLRGGRFTPGMIAAVLLLALLLGVIAGVARTLARDHGFRLSAEAAGLRRERGLFTRTEIAIPRRRIQLALVQTGLIKRRFGWYELFFQTLGTDREGMGKQSAAPLATPAEIAPILDEAKDFAMPEQGTLQRVSRRHVLKAVAAYTVFPLAAIGLAAAFLSPLSLLGMALVPGLILWAIVERREHRYALTGDMLYVRRGLWQQRLWILPVRNAQTVTVTRSPVQRLLGLSTVLVDTAGASLFSDPRIVDLRHDAAEALADEIAGRLRL